MHKTSSNFQINMLQEIFLKPSNRIDFFAARGIVFQKRNAVYKKRFKYFRKVNFRLQ